MKRLDNLQRQNCPHIDPTFLHDTVLFVSIKCVERKRKGKKRKINSIKLIINSHAIQAVVNEM